MLFQIVHFSLMSVASRPSSSHDRTAQGDGRVSALGGGWVGIFQNACLMRTTGVSSTLQLTKFRPLERVASST